MANFRGEAIKLRLAFSQLRLFDEHLDVLNKTKTLEGCRNLQASWARREWAFCLSRILGDLNEASVLDKAEQVDLESEELQDQQVEDAKLLFKITIRAASIRGWTQSVWSELPPFSWSGLLSPQPEEARLSLNQMRAEQEAVDAAVAASQESGLFEHPERQAAGCHIVCYLHRF